MMQIWVLEKQIHFIGEECVENGDMQKLQKE